MPVIVDLHATFMGSHSEEEQAAPTYNEGLLGYQLWSLVDHGAEGIGEPLSVILHRATRFDTATDHIAVIKAALAQLPSHRRG